jgi:hypothetical protein
MKRCGQVPQQHAGQIMRWFHLRNFNEIKWDSIYRRLKRCTVRIIQLDGGRLIRYLTIKCIYNTAEKQTGSISSSDELTDTQYTWLFNPPSEKFHSERKRFFL